MTDPGECPVCGLVNPPETAACDCGYAFYPKGRPGFPDAVDVDALRAAVLKNASIADLKASGFLSVIFGGLALYPVVSHLSTDPQSLWMGLLGAALVVEGIWLTAKPSPRGLLVDGMALVGLGASNVVVTLSELKPEGGSWLGAWLALGAYQCLWGVQRFARYRRYIAATRHPVQPEMAEQAKTILGLLHVALADRAGILTFSTKMATRAETWRAYLLANAAVVTSDRGDALVEARSDFSIYASKHALVGDGLKGSVQIGAFSGSIVILPRELAKYAAWKNMGN